MLKFFYYIKGKIQKRSNRYQSLAHTKLYQKNQQKGQVLIEYILLISIVIIIARVLMEGLVFRGQGDDEGIVIKSWKEVSKTIAEDSADEPN